MHAVVRLTCVRLLVLLSLPLLAGCGGGSSTSQGSSPSAGTAAGIAASESSGLNVTLRVKSQVTTLKSESGYRLRVHVRGGSGDADLVSSQTVEAPTAEGASVKVGFGIVPSSASLVVVETLAPDDGVVGTQSSPFTWSSTIHTSGIEVAMTVAVPVRLSPSNVLAVPATATLHAGQSLQLGAVGGSGAYHYRFETTPSWSGSTLDAMSGLLTAGTRGNVIEEIAIVDAADSAGYAYVAVSPSMQLSPPSASVATGEKVAFQVVSGLPARYWRLLVNHSGGTIDPQTGVYTAGPNANAQDVVAVTDGADVATALVCVGSPLSVVPARFGNLVHQTRQLRVTGGTRYTWRLIDDMSGATLAPHPDDTSVCDLTSGAKADVADVVAVSDVSGAITVLNVPVAAKGLSISASPNFQLFSGKQVTLTGSGGFPPYTWTIETPTIPGSRIAQQSNTSAVYTGGGVPLPGTRATDVARMTDSLGYTTSITLYVYYNPGG